MGRCVDLEMISKVKSKKFYTAISLITIILISVICKERLNNRRIMVEAFQELKTETTTYCFFE